MKPDTIHRPGAVEVVDITGNDTELENHYKGIFRSLLDKICKPIKQSINETSEAFSKIARGKDVQYADIQDQNMRNFIMKYNEALFACTGQNWRPMLIFYNEVETARESVNKNGEVSDTSFSFISQEDMVEWDNLILTAMVPGSSKLKSN